MKSIKIFYLILSTLFINFSCKNKKEQQITPQEKLSTFNYTPNKPLNGKLMGIVELGAAGFNSFIINVDKDLNWELEKKEYGTSLIVEGMTNTDLINSKLRSYIDKTVSYGLSEDDIHFMVSSGAAKEEITQIISKELKNIGHKVNHVTAKEEGYYGLQANLPKKFKDNSFLVDLGSGNTKISYFKDDKTVVTLETHGAKYYQKDIEDEDVYADIKELTSKIPQQNRTKCFIIGGVPTKLARDTNPKEELYTVLSTNTKTYKELADKEGKKVKSGLNIYKAIQEGAQVKEVIYVLDGNFTVGFLLEKMKLKA